MSHRRPANQNNNNNDPRQAIEISPTHSDTRTEQEIHRLTQLISNNSNENSSGDINSTSALQRYHYSIQNRQNSEQTVAENNSNPNNTLAAHFTEECINTSHNSQSNVSSTNNRIQNLINSGSSETNLIGNNNINSNSNSRIEHRDDTLIVNSFLSKAHSVPGNANLQSAANLSYTTKPLAGNHNVISGRIESEQPINVNTLSDPNSLSLSNSNKRTSQNTFDSTRNTTSTTIASSAGGSESHNLVDNSYKIGLNHYTDQIFGRNTTLSPSSKINVEQKQKMLENLRIQSSTISKHKLEQEALLTQAQLAQMAVANNNNNSTTNSVQNSLGNLTGSILTNSTGSTSDALNSGRSILSSVNVSVAERQAIQVLNNRQAQNLQSQSNADAQIHVNDGIAFATSPFITSNRGNSVVRTDSYQSCDTYLPGSVHFPNPFGFTDDEANSMIRRQEEAQKLKDEQKKQKHNNIEKRRRDKVNTHQMYLGYIIPQKEPEEKWTKFSRLSTATRHIEFLHSLYFMRPWNIIENLINLITTNSAEGGLGMSESQLFNHFENFDIDQCTNLKSILENCDTYEQKYQQIRRHQSSHLSKIHEHQEITAQENYTGTHVTSQTNSNNSTNKNSVEQNSLNRNNTEIKIEPVEESTSQNDNEIRTQNSLTNNGSVYSENSNPRFHHMNSLNTQTSVPSSVSQSNYTKLIRLESEGSTNHNNLNMNNVSSSSHNSKKSTNDNNHNQNNINIVDNNNTSASYNSIVINRNSNKVTNDSTNNLNQNINISINLPISGNGQINQNLNGPVNGSTDGSNNNKQLRRHHNDGHEYFQANGHEIERSPGIIRKKLKRGM